MDTRRGLRRISTVQHLVDARNWESVQATGLLSARRLMERAYSGQPEQQAPWRRHRAATTVLPDGVVIRDQRPMPPAVLARCLGDGLTPEDWYELLNSKVFFWLDPDRLNRQRRACRAAAQLVLTIDAERLLKRYGAVASVSPINLGNAMRAPAWRSAATLVAYDRWAADGWVDERRPGMNARPSNHRPVELMIDGAVPDVMTYVTSVTPLPADEIAGAS